MKRRSTDEHDKISNQEVKEARVNWWKTIKLFITNLPMIAKIIMLIIGVAGGTVAAPEAIRLVSNITSDITDVPKGQIPPPPDGSATLSVWKNATDVVNSAQTRAIDTNTAELEALRQEIRNLEARVSAQRARGDNSVSERVTANETEIKTLKGIIQP